MNKTLTVKEREIALKDIKTLLAITNTKIEELKAELNEATCQDDIKIIHSMITNNVNEYMFLQQREKELLEEAKEEKHAVNTLRTILLSSEAKEANSIFINKAGDQVNFTEEHERAKDMLHFIGGKALVPTYLEVEEKEDYAGTYTIYTSDTLNTSVTLINYKGDVQ